MTRILHGMLAISTLTLIACGGAEYVEAPIAEHADASTDARGPATLETATTDGRDDAGDLDGGAGGRS